MDTKDLSQDLSLLRFLPEERFGAIQHISPLMLGLSGAAVYTVSAAAGDFVLRINASETPNWRRQLEVQRIASNHGITPNIAWVDEAHRAVVSEKITGPLFGAALRDQATASAALASLMANLRALHAIPADHLPVVDPLEEARKLWQQQKSREGFPEWAAKYEHLFEALTPIIAEDNRHVLSHNDLNPVNILWDGTRTWLIDWEAAQRTHPYYDLAVISTFLDLPAEVSLSLLSQLEQQMPEALQIRIFLAYQHIAALLYAALFLQMVPNLQALPTKHEEDTKSLSECLAMIASGGLDLRNPESQGYIALGMLKQLSKQKAGATALA